MNRVLFAVLVSLAAMSAGAAPPAPAAITRIAAAPAREGWFVCDAIEGPYALLAGKPDATGTSVITLLDRRSGKFDTQRYQVGQADPGAGQIYWALSQGGKAVGNVHGVNPGMIEGDTGVPAITSVALAGHALECRFLARTQFIGLNSRRSVLITETPQGLVYQSFDFTKRGAALRPDGVQRSNAPTLMIAKGNSTGSGFRFSNAGYVYTLDLPAGNAPATLGVTRGGQRIAAESFVGYTVALSPSATGALPAQPLGADAVWDGSGLDACRARQNAARTDACLIETMQRGGASASAIGFTRRLIARNSSGYISAWKQAGPVGIATVTYPFRANTNRGTMLIPFAGNPIDADGYDLTAADKARPDYRAAQAQHPQAFAVPPGEIAVKPGADGGTRVLVTIATADCHACAPNGSLVIGYDFDATGRFVKAGLVMAA